MTAPPADTPGGRPVVCVDPEGAPFRLWQAGRRLGAQRVNAPGARGFSLLRTADPQAAFAFYSSFLPWAWSADASAGFIRVPGYGAHLAATSDPGILDRQRFLPEGFEDAAVFDALAPGESPHWHVSCTVPDRDATLAAVRANGGTVESTGQDEWTRHATVADPLRARFAVSQFTPPGA